MFRVSSRTRRRALQAWLVEFDNLPYLERTALCNRLIRLLQTLRDSPYEAKWIQYPLALADLDKYIDQ